MATKTIAVSTADNILEMCQCLKQKTSDSYAAVMRLHVWLVIQSKQIRDKSHQTFIRLMTWRPFSTSPFDQFSHKYSKLLLLQNHCQYFTQLVWKVKTSRIDSNEMLIEISICITIIVCLIFRWESPPLRPIDAPQVTDNFPELRWIHNYHTYWKRQGVNGPNLWQSLMAYTKVLPQNDWQWYQTYGNVIGFYEVFKRCLIINDPKLVKDILVKDFHIFVNRRYYCFGDVFDSGIVLAKDDDWKRIRGVVSQAFTSSKLKSMTTKIAEIADQFCLNISEESLKGLSLNIMALNLC